MKAMKLIKSLIKKAVPFAVMITLMTVPAFANGISDSTVGVGVKNLLTDLSKYMMIIGPIAGAAAAGYFMIRRSMADEQDGKFWQKRITVAIFCGVGVLLVGGVIALVSSYF